jgi:GNAT superfamily N-acetyltransferase
MDPAKMAFFTPTDTPSYNEKLSGLPSICWPEFMLHDPVADEFWDDLIDLFPEYQFALNDVISGKTVAMANSVPIHWDGDSADLPEEGWDWVFRQGVEDHKAGRKPKTLSAIQIAIHPEARGQGLSKLMVEHMRAIAKEKGFGRLIAPVRPNQKSQYPLVSIDDYITWKDEAGLPFDAWLRTHVKLGATILHPCHQSMEIKGSITMWEKWTGLKFATNGLYTIPGGLVPLTMQVGLDLGVYIEPNVWTLHTL